MKQKLIIAGLIVAGLASITYAALTQSLVITGTASTTTNWDVKITGVMATALNGATVTAAPTFTNTSATFAVNLDHPGATADFEVTVANTGTIDAILDSISGVDTANTAVPLGIQYEVIGLDTHSALTAGNAATATVRVVWDPAATLDAHQTKTATITFNYVQDTL